MARWMDLATSIARAEPAAETDWLLSARIAGVHAVLDAAAMSADPWRRHAMLDQALRELRAIHQAHADGLTVAALESA